MNISSFSKTYGGTVVLDFPGLTLETGKIYAVIGANGSGKSTFAKILAGVEKADQPGRPHDAGHLGYLPQNHYAFRMSTKANILLGNKDAAKADKMMEDMGITHLASKPAHRLSGGETARMALCRLMMKTYDLLVLDEPTAAMDMEATSLAERLILDHVQKTGCTLILVTHSLPQARRIAHRVLYFHKGQLAEYGPTAILDSPSDSRTRRFLEFCGI